MLGPIDRARYLAQRAHAGQMRKNGTTPYVVHVERVANKVATHPLATEDMIVAAWLHDVVEDTTYCTFTDIEWLFNIYVESLVFHLTNEYTSKAYPDMNRHERKLAEAKRHKQHTIPVKIIKLADRIDNLQDSDGGLTEGFRHKYMKESLALFEALNFDEEDPFVKELYDMLVKEHVINV